MTKPFELTSTDTECTCGTKLERTTQLLYANCIQMYSHCPKCKSTWTFEAWFHKEATNFYQE